MKMFYYKDPNGNFGDDLNLWMWPRLLPGVFDEIPGDIFVGIGTLINENLPLLPRKHIFGSGFGYGHLPLVDANFVFYAVRGYETAKALNLSPKLVITDPAILVRSLYLPIKNNKTSPIGFMPTGHSITNYDWESVCKDLGFRFISCHWTVERVLAEISSCRVLMAEAMHGAIIADALRIPWIPINCYGYVLDFKWLDWLSSINISYYPQRITPLYGKSIEAGTINRLKRVVKHSLLDCHIWSKNWTLPPRRESSPAVKERVMKEMLSASLSHQFLSPDSLVDSLTSRYLELVEQFDLTHNRSNRKLQGQSIARQ